MTLKEYPHIQGGQLRMPGTVSGNLTIVDAATKQIYTKTAKRKSWKIFLNL